MKRPDIVIWVIVWLCTLVGASYSARQGHIDGFLSLFGDLPALPFIDGPGE